MNDWRVLQTIDSLCDSIGTMRLFIDRMHDEIIEKNREIADLKAKLEFLTAQKEAADDGK